jgi:Na+/proline symporter
VAQRIFSARTEKDGILATLAFQIAHYALRPWPWIVTGLATVILYPDLTDKEAGYVRAVVDLLPTPWRGVMLAGFAAAYMSTVGTHLNWGASYLVNDVYKRFLRVDASERHYVAVSRAATVLIFLASIGVTSQLSSIERAWELLLGLGAGTGLVLILRWYWWRINAWSEISAMIASFVLSVAGFAFIAPRFTPNDPNATAVVMLVTVAGSTIVWLAVTFATPPETDAVLDAFYRRVRPGGPGWTTVSSRLGFGPEPIPGGALAWTNWLAGIIAVYATLFGLGKLIFGYIGSGIALMIIAALAFAWIARTFRSERNE